MVVSGRTKVVALAVSTLLFMTWATLQVSRLALTGVSPSRVSLTPRSATPYFSSAPDKEALGNAGWTLLHSIATNWGDSPTDKDREDFSNFIALFGKFYPCRGCSGHFLSMIEELPPRTESRESLRDWLHEAHNRVNVRLKKPLFPADRVDERWKNDHFGMAADERDRALNGTKKGG